MRVGGVSNKDVREVGMRNDDEKEAGRARNRESDGEKE